MVCLIIDDDTRRLGGYRCHFRRFVSGYCQRRTLGSSRLKWRRTPSSRQHSTNPRKETLLHSRVCMWQLIWSKKSASGMNLEINEGKTRLSTKSSCGAHHWSKKSIVTKDDSGK